MSLPSPTDRREIYLNAIATGETSDLPTPSTREEVYLDYIAKNGSGGGGGTSNYNNLSNKPQINGVTLSGNKSADDLNLIGKSQTSGHVMNDGTIDTNAYEKSGVAESLVKDTVGWTGKNLWENDDISGTQYVTVNLERPLSAGTYTLSAVVTSSDVDATTCRIYDYTNSIELGQIARSVSNDRTHITFTVSNAVRSILLYASSTYDLSAGDSFSFEDIQIEIGSSATSYEPYHATVDTVKADKVTNATAGHLAGLDSNGNLTDSGVSPTEDVTVEGNPVTFESPFEQDAKSVVVSVKPIQDLHGYDNPWAGGAGKNELNPSLLSFQSNGYVWTPDYNTVGSIPVDVSTQYTLSFKQGVGDGRIYQYDANGQSVGTVGTFSNPRVTFTTEADCAKISFRYKVLVDELPDVASTEPMLEKSSTPTSYAPYSNICPISGIDELEIGVSGENLFDVGDSISEWLATGSNGLKILEGSISSRVTANIDKSTGSIKVTNYDTTGWWWMSKVIKLTKNTNYKLVNFGSVQKKIVGLNSLDANTTGTEITVSDGVFNSGNYDYWIISIFPNAVDLTNVMILLADETDTTFEPYQSNTTTIPLPSTLYGGTVDVTSGDADSKWKKVTFNSKTGIDLFYQYDGTTFKHAIFRFDVSDMLPEASPNLENIKSNWAEVKYVNDNSVYNMFTCRKRANQAQILLFTPTDWGEVTLDELGDFLAQNPIEFCYELATPITLSLTPTDVELLEGTNVVSTNGEKVAVTYGRSLWQDINDLKTDTEGKLDKSDVADVEGDTASRPYAVNDFMLRSDGFYKVTQPIAQNASITSSNTTKTTIGAVLTALLNA